MTMTADGTMNPRIMRDQLYVLPVIEVSDQLGLQLKSNCPLLLIPRVLIFQDSKPSKIKRMSTKSGVTSFVTRLFDSDRYQTKGELQSQVTITRSI